MTLSLKSFSYAHRPSPILNALTVGILIADQAAPRTLGGQRHPSLTLKEYMQAHKGRIDLKLNRTCPDDRYTGYSSLCIFDLSGVLSAAP